MQNCCKFYSTALVQETFYVKYDIALNFRLNIKN